MAHQLRFGISQSQYWTSPRSYLRGINFKYLYCFIEARLWLKNHKSNITPKALYNSDLPLPQLRFGSISQSLSIMDFPQVLLDGY